MNRKFAIIISIATVLLVGLLIALSVFRSSPQSSDQATITEVVIPTGSPNNQSFTSTSSNIKSNDDIQLDSADTSAVDNTVKKLPIDTAEFKVEYSDLLDTFYVQSTATDAAQLNQFLEENNLANLYKSHPKFFKFTIQNPKDVLDEDEYTFINENGQGELIEDTEKTPQETRLAPLKNILNSLVAIDFPTPSVGVTSTPQPATTSGQGSASVGSFQNGFPVSPADSTKIPCPNSPTVSEVGNKRIYANGVGYYNIKLCKVHGYYINSVKAKDFDNMYTAFKLAGYTFRGGAGNFRTYDAQAAGHAANPSAWAPPGGSNHERGLAVDTSCKNKDGTKAYNPWMGGKARGLKEFARAVAEHPCLNWIHNNSRRYGLLLQCDAKGKNGGEMAASKGGCETWHLSPTGG